MENFTRESEYIKENQIKTIEIKSEKIRKSMCLTEDWTWQEKISKVEGEWIESIHAESQSANIVVSTEKRIKDV